MSRKSQLLTTRIVSVLVASMVTMGLSGQMPAKRPTLVVGIMVDGLSLDNLDLLKGYFGNGGLMRLLNEGITVTDVDYGSQLDAASATAVVFTGSSPAVNGIADETVYDRTSRRVVPFFLDNSTIGNYTDETLSPKALNVSTIGDEIRISSGGLGHIHSIAPSPAQALVMGSHAGNSAFWINDITGKWATSTHYKDVPTAIQSRNHRMPLENRLDTMAWSSLLKPEEYPDMPSYKKLFSFRHTFYRNDPDRYRRFKASPLVNREITELASDYIRSMNLGKGENIDMINIAYTVSPYLYGKDSDTRMELMDSYIRLDKEIESLFKSIDVRGPGMNNTLVFLAGTPATITCRREDEKWALTSGEFSPRRAISLLNMYLIAIHGNGDWVVGFHDNQFFLNHDLIKTRDKDLRSIRHDAADFIKRMAGITEAYSLDDIIDGKNADTQSTPRRNINIETAGDVFASILPGWEVIDDGTTAPDPNSYPMSQRVVAPFAPAFILTPALAPQTISSPVDARAIAPTITSILRIRSPNSAQKAPLRIKAK